MRAIIPGAASGSSAVAPSRFCPLVTVRRVVPSRSISQQTRLGGGGEPEHGDDRGEAARAPGRRGGGGQAAGARADAGHIGGSDADIYPLARETFLPAVAGHADATQAAEDVTAERLAKSQLLAQSPVSLTR